jgi:rhodanese-related sulfurtransferase
MSRSRQRRPSGPVPPARTAAPAARNPRLILVAAAIVVLVIAGLSANAFLVAGRSGQGGATPTAAAPESTSLPPEVDVAGGGAMRDAGAFVLDVREPSEWAEVHIPGATLIPLGELEQRVAEVPRERDVLVVCRSGNRSAQGRDIIRAAGFERVTSMAGGMNDWTAAGYETVSGP